MMAKLTSDTRELIVNNAFRELRTAWFNTVLMDRGYEREFETDENLEMRTIRNKTAKIRFDADTESIILGHSRSVCPRCQNDMNQ